MIGSGKAHVHTIASIAQAQCKDGPAPEPVTAMASIGAFGRHPSNAERDLHRWLKSLYGIDLQPYYVKMNLLVAVLKQSLDYM